MLYCIPKLPQPCIQYDAANVTQLNAFLIENGGVKAQIEDSGKAQILTKIRDEQRFVYCLPGSWVRCFAPGQFTASSNAFFLENFQLV